jgi:hypothetical protein
MSPLIRLHRSSRQLLLAAVAFVLMIGLLSAGQAAAHTFTKTDGNDSRGRLDIRTASVSHHLKAVVHTVRTYDSWKQQTLENDSFFVIQIDKTTTGATNAARSSITVAGVCEGCSPTAVRSSS